MHPAGSTIRGILTYKRAFSPDPALLPLANIRNGPNTFPFFLFSSHLLIFFPLGLLARKRVHKSEFFTVCLHFYNPLPTFGWFCVFPQLADQVSIREPFFVSFSRWFSTTLAIVGSVELACFSYFV